MDEQLYDQQQMDDGQYQQNDQYGQEEMGDYYGGYEGQEVQQQEGDGMNALNLKWVLGFNKDIDQGVHNLTTDQRHEIFYSAAHSGVIYDYLNRSQTLLQGHCNQITATACSDDKAWIVTADSGEDSMLIVWDSMTGTPVRTFLNPHPDGIKCLDLSSDNLYLVTLGNDVPQTISLWDWTNEKEEGPIVSLQFKYTQEFQNQHWVKFNPNDPTELASNGKERVLFLNWEAGISQFQYYSPRIEKKDFNNSKNAMARFTKTVFIPNSEMAVTGTDIGYVIVWDRSLIIEGIGEQNEKRLIKIVALNELNSNLVGSEINILTTVHDKYLVCGNENGTIRFFDFYFKVVAWFSDCYLHNVKSISFSKTDPEPSQTNNEYSGDTDEVFSCSEFLVTDSNAMIAMLKSKLFEEIEPGKKKGQTIMHGIKSAISAIAVHPRLPILAIAGEAGFILLWDYIKKANTIENYDHFSKDEFTRVEFTTDGNEILVAQTNGEIRILETQSGQWKKLNSPLKTSESKRSSVTQLIVSDDGKYFAVCDTNKCVSLFIKNHLHGDVQKPVEWQFNGKIMSHENDVCSIAFGHGLDEQGAPMNRLFSIGKDRRMFEYDVYASTYNTKLVVKSHFKIEQEFYPSSCIWYPKKDSKEGLLLTAISDYKMKVWNPSAQSSRKTCLGPTYGGEVNRMKKLVVQSQEEAYLIYSTATKVIGLIKMPLDGNPNKTMGLIAHPGEVADFCASSDGKYLFTCGGEDLSVKMWKIDINPIEYAIARGGEGIEPFINLIEGGREGQNYQDMKDFFYYSMIRSKDENTTKTRKLDGTVPLDELPNLMRAMGYYPTEHEVKQMKDEVMFSEYSEDGIQTTCVDMNTFIRLFVNHRPVYGIGKGNIDEAFKSLVSGESGNDQYITKDELKNALQNDGEAMTNEDLQDFVMLLVGEDINKAFKQQISADEFAENILGFEEVEEGEDEEEEAQERGDVGQNMTGGTLGGINEAIPEEEGA